MNTEFPKDIIVSIEYDESVDDTFFLVHKNLNEVEDGSEVALYKRVQTGVAETNVKFIPDDAQQQS